MPNSFCGWVFFASWPVMSANFLAPLLLKFMVTCQPAAVWVSKTAWAFLTSVPSTAAGPSRYLYQTAEPSPPPPVVSVGLAPSPALLRCAFLEQSRAVYWAWSLAWAEDVSVPPLAGADGDAELDALADADGVESAFSASVTARPCEVAEADGEDDEVAFSPVEPDLLAEGLGEAGGGPRGCRWRPGPGPDGSTAWRWCRPGRGPLGSWCPWGCSR